MTIFVTWQLIVTLDSIPNSCEVYSLHQHTFSSVLLEQNLLAVNSDRTSYSGQNRSQHRNFLRFSLIPIVSQKLIQITTTSSTQGNSRNARNLCNKQTSVTIKHTIEKFPENMTIYKKSFDFVLRAFGRGSHALHPSDNQNGVKHVGNPRPRRVFPHQVCAVVSRNEYNASYNNALYSCGVYHCGQLSMSEVSGPSDQWIYRSQVKGYIHGEYVCTQWMPMTVFWDINIGADKSDHLIWF